jgi:hypothetical protein
LGIVAVVSDNWRESVTRRGTGKPRSRLKRGDWDEVTNVFIKTQQGDREQVKGSLGGLMETKGGGWNERG